MKYNWWIGGDSVVVLSLFAVASILRGNFVFLFSVEVGNLGVLSSLPIIMVMKNKLVNLF